MDFPEETVTTTTAPTPTLVSEADFLAAEVTARSTRVKRYILWQLIPKQTQCCGEEDPYPMVWVRISANPTKEYHQRTIHKVERYGDHYTWLLTEEHHDILGNHYTTDDEPLEPTWQPEGPALLRTADNPTHWIPVKRVIPWHYMAAMAVTDTPMPEDWVQPPKPHLQEDTSVWVHFTPTHGPFVMSRALTRFQGQRFPTPQMVRFLDGKLTETPSAADMTSAILAYISVHRLAEHPLQLVTPDQKLSELLGSPQPFYLSDLQRHLQPTYGPFVTDF